MFVTNALEPEALRSSLFAFCGLKFKIARGQAAFSQRKSKTLTAVCWTLMLDRIPKFDMEQPLENTFSHFFLVSFFSLVLVPNLRMSATCFLISPDASLAMLQTFFVLAMRSL